MFFLGLLVGGGIYFIGFLIYYFFHRPGWAIALMVAACVALTAVYPRLGGASVAAVIVLFIIFYFVDKHLKKKDEEKDRLEEERKRKEQLRTSDYKSHCWNCGEPIDGSWNEKCPKCNKYYICPKCGVCKCDYPQIPYHHD